MSNAVAFESHIGESLLIRNQFINSFKQLGPPDHLHIINCDGDVNAGDKTDDYKQSCFLHLVGLDNSSVSSMAATIARLLTTQNLKAWFDDLTVIRGTLSTFNPFSAIDVRVQVSLPGGVFSYGINQDDQKVDIDKFQDIFWHEIYVVSILRSWSLEPPVSSTLGPLYRENVFPDERSIIKFLKSAYHVYSESSTTFEVHSFDGNFLICYVKSILNALGRSDLLLKWVDGSLFNLPPLEIDEFTNLAYLQGLVFASRQSEAFNKLKIDFDSERSTSQLYFEYDFLFNRKDFNLANKIAKLLVLKQSSNALSWLNYASTQIELDLHEDALISLNSAPVNNYQPNPEMEFYKTLKPASRFCHVRENVDLLEQLTLIPDGTAQEPLSNPILKSVYRILAKMAAKLTWDGLLTLRNKIFVMETEDMIFLPENQRLCEKWLDDLFLVLVVNLDVVQRLEVLLEHKE
eukprot:NODE_15_length_42055_cov_0.634117.p9 type:complete len:461 gc:universal NODE_15_length_42055_cov_0.634117:2404-1022(-)